MPASSRNVSTAVDCDAEPYMLSLYVADDSMDAEKMTPVLDPHKLEASLRAATSDLESLHERGEKKCKKDPSSGPPSPPSSDGSTTPRVSIVACPARFKPYSPPVNYGTVEVGQIYRSGFPHDRNMDFCRGLHIRSVLTLVDSPPSEGYTAWIASPSITHLTIPLATNKDGRVNTTTASLCRALLFIMDSTNYPVHIHCNQGKHRTGCLVACLRKIQRVPLEQVLKEYIAYASPKQRNGDIKLITDFDPEVVYAYAKQNGYLDGGALSRFVRNDSSVGDISSLAAAMAAGATLGQDDALTSAVSSSSTMTMASSSDSSLETSDDEALEMSLPPAASKPTTNPPAPSPSSAEENSRTCDLNSMTGMEETSPPTMTSSAPQTQTPAQAQTADNNTRSIDPRLRIKA